MYRTGNPLSDFLRHDAEMEEAAELLPVCSECGEHIQSDYLYEINDELICESCMKDNYRKQTTDFMG